MAKWYISSRSRCLEKVIIQKEELSEVRFATYEEIDDLYKNHEFMENRWEFVRDEIKNLLKN